MKFREKSPKFPEKTPDFYYTGALRIETHSAPKDAPHEAAVRLYSEQALMAWLLQVRSPVRLQGGRKGKGFVLSNVTLDRGGMRALRDAIDAHLRECDEWEAWEKAQNGKKEAAVK